MLTLKPFESTFENQQAIPVYRSKWQKIARSVEPIDRERATEAIAQAYEFLGLADPKIIFFDDPDEALNYVHREVLANWGKLERTTLGNAIASSLIQKLLGNINSPEGDAIMERLGGNLDEGRAKSIASEIVNRLDLSYATSLMFAHMTSALDSSIAADSELTGVPKALFKSVFDLISGATFIQSVYMIPLQGKIFAGFIDLFAREHSQQVYDSWREIGSDIISGRANRKQTGEYLLPTVQLSGAMANVFIPPVMTDYAYYIDYCHQVLGCDRNYLKWCIFRDLVTSCGWFFPYEKTVLMCDRT